MPETAAKAALQAKATATAAKSVPPLVNKDKVECLCKSVRDLKQGRVRALSVMPVLHSFDGKTYKGDAFLTKGIKAYNVDVNLVSHYMGLYMRVVAARLVELNSQNSPLNLIVPIHARVLLDKETAGVFTHALRKLLPEERARLVVEVTQIGDDVSLTYIDDIAIIVFAFCQGYVARTKLSFTRHKTLANCNFSGVGVDLSGKSAPPPAILSTIKKFCALSEQSRLPVFWHNVDNADVMRLAKEYKINYVDGLGVGASEDSAATNS